MNEFQITGLNELFLDLSDAARSVKGRARSVVERNIGKVTETAKSIAPVETGETRDSIDDEVVEGGGRVYGLSGPHTRQAIFAEWGTSVMAPRAFMGPALDRHAADFEAELWDEAANI